MLTVRVADCAALLIADSRRGAVAAVHAGWRGTAAGVARETVAALVARGSAPGDIVAVLGPSIGACCYEVGPEVLVEFEDLGEGIADGRMLDLRAVVRRLLERAGVDSVVASELCTRCNPELFFSHRRDGERTGRQAGVAWREE